MKWTLLLLTGLFLVVLFTLRAAPGLPVAAARDHLQRGALLIDVRTVEEFNAGHLTNAVNIPLDELSEVLPLRVTNKSRVLLLHCRTGRRSGIAEKQLRAMGYTNSFNVGSYQQAASVVSGRGQ